jgi:Sec-independent protein translocase protein TatA
MSVRFGQILILLFLLMLFFGDLPKVIRHLAKTVKEWKTTFNEKKSESNDEVKKIKKREANKKSFSIKKVKWHYKKVNLLKKLVIIRLT